MNSGSDLDLGAGLTQAVLGFIESGGWLAAGLAMAISWTVAFCVGRLVERAASPRHQAPSPGHRGF